MKILYLEWNSFGNDYIKSALINRGYELVIFELPSDEDTRSNESLSQKIVCKAIENRVNFAFSLNYFPVAAIACKALNIKYVSWTYDSPYIRLYSLTIEYPTNYAFIFDYSEYLRFKKLGINTVYYLPMAACTEVFDTVKITENDHKKYDADIAMIGSTYNEKKHRLIRHFDKIDDYAKGYTDSLLLMQKGIFGTDIIEPALTEDIVSRLQKSAPMTQSGDGLETLAWTFSKYFLARELTRIERHEYLDALSNKFKVTLYTHEPTPELPHVNNKGELDYYTQMPQVIKCAKINLNITLRSIVTGIPLRAMDILGCGGFLLTSYQADMESFFESGKDYIYYDSLNSLMESCEYYLNHESERLDIASNGYKKAKKYHNLNSRLDDIEAIILQ